MARKKKPRKPQMPPLGTLDKWIYGIALAVTGVGMLGFLLLGWLLSKGIAFADPRVVAADYGGLAGILLSGWCVVVFMTLLLRANRDHPIFGRKDISYGPPKYPEIYPLMMKNAPDTWRSPTVAANRRINRKILLWLAVGTLVISMAAFLLGLNNRTVLHGEGSISVYSGWNREKEHFDTQDVLEVRLNTYLQRGGKGEPSSWNVETYVVFEERSYRFRAVDFEGDWFRRLQTMLSLKQEYMRRGIPVVIGGTDRLEDVIDDRNLGPEEVELLYRLFEVSPTE